MEVARQHAFKGWGFTLFPGYPMFCLVSCAPTELGTTRRRGAYGSKQGLESVALFKRILHMLED